jgi:hypothetical protein
MSQNKRFTAVFYPQANVLSLRRYTTWLLLLQDEKGLPVTQASLGVSAGMFGKGHGHGMPTTPQVTEYRGNGIYQVEGVLFNMPGQWTFLIDVEREGIRDRIRIDMDIDYSVL